MAEIRLAIEGEDAIAIAEQIRKLIIPISMKSDRFL